MRLSFSQELRQVQRQILAPRMIQSMEILQLPIMALEERIEQEMEENPVLEMQEDDPDLPDEQVEAENPDSPTENERELVVDEAKNNEEDFERLLKLGEDFSDQFDERPRPSRNRVEEEGDRKHDAMANMTSRPQSLHDYLNDQLGYFDLEPALREMASRIIYNLDSNGYVQGRLEDLIGPHADEEQLTIAEQALQVVQKLDPPGVGAQSLRECLLLQLRPGMPCYESLRMLITSHLEDIEHNRLPVIQRRTGYTMEVIQETISELRKLNPKPGSNFTSSQVPIVTPDIFIDEGEHGGYSVRLEDGRTPKLFISHYYRTLLTNGQGGAETREFLKRKINAAQWLIESIEQRRSTLTRVAQAIVDHQTGFLNQESEHIEPLKMQQIADKVGVHVTTVSRAVDDKWMQTPRGIFPLKRFFGGGTVTDTGEEVAWDAVRLKLQEIVDHEDKRSPFSDDELVQQLKDHGFKVARRTVTKYRKAMKIPSSRQRRDWSLAQSGSEPRPDSANANGPQHPADTPSPAAPTSEERNSSTQL